MLKKLFANKTVAYFVAAGIALLALLTAIIFFATYKGNMGNYAAGLAPETIGIFLIAGFVVELVFLVLPQYRVIHVAALVMYGLAFYKETVLMPDFVAGKVNNVEYNGGSFNLNLFYFIMLLVILIAAVVVSFLNFYKSEEEANKEMAIEKGNVKQIVKVSAGAAVVLVAVLVGSIVAKSMYKSQAAVDPLITTEVRKAANDYEYDFDPTSVLIKEKEAYTDDDFNSDELKAIPYDAKRNDAHLVYYFEGAYSEGYQGDYGQTYAELFLWDDGFFGGKASDRNIRGYWFNSSLEDGADAKGNNIKDCLRMVTNIDRYESIICQEAKGFYQWQAYMYLHMSWGGDRSIIMNGYYYYPDVALIIDTVGSELKAVKGEEFDISFWQPSRVLKNLTYTSVLKGADVKWSVEDESGKVTRTESGGLIEELYVIFSETGKHTITAKWTATKVGIPDADDPDKGQITFSASVEVEVVEPEE